MLTTTVQEKIFNRLLSSQGNLKCADCSAKSPTWASIDFGVFVCLNCSGAHRALGPSVTRVRSTKLDTWQNAWIEFMGSGNDKCNEYWEQSIGISKKPTPSSALEEIKRFVVDKYVKKKFTKDNQSKPVSEYKRKPSQDISSHQPHSAGLPNKKDEPKVASQKQKESFDIFDFDDAPVNSSHQSKKNVHSVDVNLLQGHGSHGHNNHSHEPHASIPSIPHPLNFNSFNQGLNLAQQYQKPHLNSTFSHSANSNVQHQNNFMNMLPAHNYNIPQNIQMNPTQQPAPQTTPPSFDIFGGAPKSSPTPPNPINFSINMYANNINFNFGEKAKAEEKKDKDPFNILDEFSF